MAYTAKQLVKIAQAEIGYKETSLDDKYTKDLVKIGYNKDMALNSIFVDWCFFQLANQNAILMQKFECQTGALGSDCSAAMNYYEKAGRLYKSNPQEGDQIFFRYKSTSGADRTGIVESISGSMITTIEGVNNSVSRRTYLASNPHIAGFGRPYYDDKEIFNYTPVDKPYLNYQIGDIVNFIGRLQYTSSNSTTGLYCQPGVAKITAISNTGKHKYHLEGIELLNHKASTIKGWIDGKYISNKISVIEEPIEEESKVSQNEIQNQEDEEVANLKIGHIVIDELGKATGRFVDSQSDNKICVSKWYNKPWTAIYRPISSDAAEKIAVAMEQACANENINYNRSKRTSLYDAAQKVKWDLSQITEECGSDCSALVAVCVNAAGIKVNKNMQTKVEDNMLMKTGKFSKLTSDLLIKGTDYLQRGDILLGNHHTGIVLSNGDKVEVKTNDNKNSSYVGKGIGTITTLLPVEVKSGAGARFKKIGAIAKNKQAEVLAIANDNWYKIVWPTNEAGYAYVWNEDEKYFSYEENPANPGASANIQSKTVNYSIQLTTNILNVHKGPGLQYGVSGVIRNKGVYTIIKECGNWGYLKSGLGWIDLSNGTQKI